MTVIAQDDHLTAGAWAACEYTSLNKILCNFSKVLMAHMSFTAVINNGGIRKGIGGIQKGTKKNYIYVL